MVSRLFAQNGLTADIMLSHGERTESISRYLNLFSGCRCEGNEQN